MTSESQEAAAGEGEKRYTITPTNKCVFRPLQIPANHTPKFDSCGSLMAWDNWNFKEMVHNNGVVRLVYYFQLSAKKGNAILPMRPGVFLTKSVVLLEAL